MGAKAFPLSFGFYFRSIPKGDRRTASSLPSHPEALAGFQNDQIPALLSELNMNKICGAFLILDAAVIGENALGPRRARIISAQHITKREFARRIGVGEAYAYVLTRGGRSNSLNQNISPAPARVFGTEFGYDPA